MCRLVKFASDEIRTKSSADRGKAGDPEAPGFE
jgi:hypothetical protein